MSKTIRIALNEFFKRYVKWYVDNYGDIDIPDKEITVEIYRWLPDNVKPHLTESKFHVLFKIRVAAYLENQKGK